MCGRYALVTPADVLARLLDITGDSAGLVWSPRRNIAPTQMAPVVRTDPASGERQLALLRWGLIPGWVQDPQIGARLINARSESAAQKRAFRSAFRSRRCIVPADGFFEWRPVGRQKQPYFIYGGDGRPLAMAGLWERWSDQAGQTIESFTILTTEANRTMRALHDRMPVILPLEAVSRWLDPTRAEGDELQSLLEPASDALLRMHPVSRRVNSPFNDDPALLEPHEALDEVPADVSSPQLRLF